MAEALRNVLFVCTGNSARSILAEAVLNQLGNGRFHGYSAGSHPRGTVHPLALELLRERSIPVEGLRSKSWDEFAAPGAPRLHFVFTVCDNAAGEVCPVWPGGPVSAHWGVDDPAAVTGPGARRAFEHAYVILRRRIELLLALPLEKLDALQTRERVRAIGKEYGRS